MSETEDDLDRAGSKTLEKLLMGTTTDPSHPDLKRGADDTPVEQQSTYLVLSEEDRAQGFVKPLRREYIHKVCNKITVCNLEIAETYARDPTFYGGTYCTTCKMHRPLSEFKWDDGEEMDTKLQDAESDPASI